MSGLLVGDLNSVSSVANSEKRNTECTEIHRGAQKKLRREGNEVEEGFPSRSRNHFSESGFYEFNENRFFYKL